MANYIVSHEFSGDDPSHAQAEDCISRIDKCSFKILPTTWYVRSSLSKDEIFRYIKSHIPDDARLIVVVASDCCWTNLLVADDHLRKCWEF